MEQAPVKEDFVTVKTTLPVHPLPLNDSRVEVTTERLIIRALRPDDLAALHVLRTQQEVMKWTQLGIVDRDLADTQTKLDRNLPPNDARTYNFAICSRETGAFIGIGGCHNLEAEFGWPEVGYMFVKEAWGGGLATEFVKAFMKIWVSLPRAQTELKVDPRSVAGDGPDGTCDEQLIAITSELNSKSQAVLRKAGFESWMTWDPKNPGEEELEVALPMFRFFPTRKPKAEAS